MHFPVCPRTLWAYTASGESSTSEEMETIHARYLIACDGAHGWIRNQLAVPNEENSEESTWGVLDIVPITDFRALDLFQGSYIFLHAKFLY